MSTVNGGCFCLQGWGGLLCCYSNGNKAADDIEEAERNRAARLWATSRVGSVVCVHAGAIEGLRAREWTIRFLGLLCGEGSGGMDVGEQVEGIPAVQERGGRVDEGAAAVDGEWMDSGVMLGVRWSGPGAELDMRHKVRRMAPRFLEGATGGRGRGAWTKVGNAEGAAGLSWGWRGQESGVLLWTH